MNEKNINVPVLARVEGEGALDLKIQDDQITKLQLRIFEPPRFFEKLLEGREPNEVIDAVARICGICPVAYQMSAVNAFESIFEGEITPWVRAMRRLFLCGEWIESHAIHVHMLAGPDFMGYDSALDMAKDHPSLVKNGMRLHAVGAAILSLLGRRVVHPVGACVGGFYAPPAYDAVKSLLTQLEEAVALSTQLIEWTATLSFPQFEQDFICVALSHADEYAMNEGVITSNKGHRLDASEFEKHFHELQVPHSTALHAKLDGYDYLVGPLARVNLNYDFLPAEIKKLLDKLNFKFPSYNMSHSIVARAVEIHYALLEAINILKNYTLPDSSHVEYQYSKGTGYGVTEAPRGLLWQRYETNNEGLIKTARIVPPTSQNQARIENDLKQSLLQYGLDHDDETLKHFCEVIIRNYDPCISCSTHFLTLKVDRQ